MTPKVRIVTRHTEQLGTETNSVSDLFFILCCCFGSPAEKDRREFSTTLPTATATPQPVHEVVRKDIYHSVINLFTQGVENQFPLRISFKDERGVDVGGLYRDMLSAFWDQAYCNLFDGGSLLTPVLHPQVDLGALPVLGKVLSHGYLNSGFLPVRVSFPTLATLLLQPATISAEFLTSAFLQTVSVVESNALKKAMHVPIVSSCG